MITSLPAHQPFIEPSSAYVSLITHVEEGVRKPFIQIKSAQSYSLTDKVGDLELSMNENSSKALTAYIKGFTYTKNVKSNPPAAAITSPYKNLALDINILQKIHSLPVTFYLKGEKNSFVITYDSQKKRIMLEQGQVVNIKIDTTKINASFVILAPLDVGFISTSEGSLDKDRLRTFAKTYGLIPAEEAYPYIIQNNPNVLYVVVPKDNSQFNLFNSLAQGKSVDKKTPFYNSIFNNINLGQIPNHRVKEFKNTLSLSVY